MRNLAIIPARSGSKGLEDKNIKQLLGKPMIAYTIEAALASGLCDCVHVSTDSNAYAQIARNYGAEVPFLRKKALASDTAGTWDVVKWALDSYREAGREFDLVTLLQPTSPLRTASDILQAYQILKEKNAKAVVSVCEMDHSPLWSNVLPADGNMNGFLREELIGRRQGLPSYYRLNGAIYMVQAALLQEETLNLYGDRTYAYVMSKENSIDIDDELDFIIAETIMARRKGL